MVITLQSKHFEKDKIMEKVMSKTTIENAENGDSELQFWMAYGYEDGIYGFEKDIEKAIYWYTRSANRGYYYAMTRLTAIYADDSPNADEKLYKVYKDRRDAREKRYSMSESDFMWAIGEIYDEDGSKIIYADSRKDK